MRIMNNRLSTLPGNVRTMYTMVVVFVGTSVLGGVGAIPGGLSFPHDVIGWVALSLLVTLYGSAFSALFILMPRLDIARNAPAMNIEPVAALLLGWVVLDQTVGGFQMVGVAMVVTGILMLARSEPAAPPHKP